MQNPRPPGPELLARKIALKVNPNADCLARSVMGDFRSSNGLQTTAEIVDYNSVAHERTEIDFIGKTGT